MDIQSAFPNEEQGVASPLSPDTVPVVPADEGSEGASLTPVTVGAHQSVSAGSIP